jgi:hypothetical protein
VLLLSISFGGLLFRGLLLVVAWPIVIHWLHCWAGAVAAAIMDVDVAAIMGCCCCCDHGCCCCHDHDWCYRDAAMAAMLLSRCCDVWSAAIAMLWWLVIVMLGWAAALLLIAMAAMAVLGDCDGCWWLRSAIVDAAVSAQLLLLLLWALILVHFRDTSNHNGINNLPRS